MVDQVVKQTLTWVEAAKWAKELEEEKIQGFLLKETNERIAKRLALREFYTARFAEVFMKSFGIDLVIHPDEIQIVGFGDKDCALFDKDGYTFRLTPAGFGSGYLKSEQVFSDFLLNIGKPTPEFYDYDPECYSDCMWHRDTVSTATQIGYAIEELDSDYENIAEAIQATENKAAVLTDKAKAAKPELHYPERNTMNFLRETAESIEAGDKLTGYQELLTDFVKFILKFADLDIPF